MDTLLIDTEFWDVCVDAAGHWALCKNPYALAQGAACAIKAFIAENYYDTTKGIPYKEQILGHYPPLSLIKENLLQRGALTVPEITDAQVFISSLDNFTLTGQVQVTDATGTIAAANFQ